MITRRPGRDQQHRPVTARPGDVTDVVGDHYLLAMPTSLAVAVAVATPIMSFLAVLLGQWLPRRSAKELDRWRRREETMRMLRWAAEAAASENSTLSGAGLAVLGELVESELLQSEDLSLVATVARVAAGVAYADQEPEAYAEADEVLVEPDGRGGAR